jgi:hypothetical protein
MRELHGRVDDLPADDNVWDTAVPDETSSSEQPLPIPEHGGGGIPLGLCGEAYEWTAFEQMDTFDPRQPNDSTD